MSVAIVEIKEASRLKLEKLGRGIDHVNVGWSLPKAIEYITELDVPNVSVFTDEPKKHLEIISRNRDSVILDKIFHRLDPSIYITDSYCRPPTLRKDGTVRIRYPQDLLVVISTDGESKDNPRVTSISLSTIYSQEKLERIAKDSIGKVPENWEINSFPADTQEIK